MKNILITGSKGQLGSEIINLSTSYSGLHFFSTDIDNLNLCNKSEVIDYIDNNSIDYIVNCAAYTAVDKAEDDIENCFLVNSNAVKNLAEAAHGKAKIIHISTDYVFDGQNTRPYKESDPTNPQSVYGKSKLEGECVLLEKCPDSIIIRTAWLYSIYGNNFVKTMIRLGKEKESLNVVYDQSGTPTNAADLAKVIIDIVLYCEKNVQFPAGIYHYSNEGICTWYDFTLKIHEFAKITTCKVNPIQTSEYPTRATRPIYSVLDKSKIKETFQLQIPFWENSLKQMTDIYISQST